MEQKDLIKNIISNSINIKELLLNDDNILANIQKACDQIITVFRNNGKLWLAGNGGSAGDAQHIAAEFTGRFSSDRPSLPAEAMHVNTSYLTAVANDYGFDHVYERMVQGSVSKNDCFIAISTSGQSINIINAIKAAKSKDVFTIVLTGLKGLSLSDEVDINIVVPSEMTPRIQECHIMIGHIICEIVENTLFPKE